MGNVNKMAEYEFSLDFRSYSDDLFHILSIRNLKAHSLRTISCQ